MSTITHEPARADPRTTALVRPDPRSRDVGVTGNRQSMWLAVLFAAVFAPDFVSSSSDGNTTRIPSAVAVALFAAIGTRVVAKYGFARRDDNSD